MTLPVKKWHGCYDDSWQDLIRPESFSHPAKFSRGLIERIVRHGLERGYWHSAGEVVVTKELRQEIIRELESKGCEHVR